MNDTPTPKSDKAKIAFTSLFANDDAYWIPYVVGVKLETELIAVTEQRDEARETLAELRASVLDLSHPNIKMILSERDEAREKIELSREWSAAIADIADDLRSELAAVTEQRDRLAEALQMITSFDYTDMQCDNGYGCRSVANEALQSLTTNNER